MRSSSLLGPALFGITASAAVAQVPPTQPDSAVPVPGVTVTATRSPAPVLTTPLAISTVTTPQLRSTAGFGIDEALSRVPGVIARSRYGTSDVQLLIRGFGARGAGDRSNSGTSRGVRVLVDGFPETEPDGRTPFDMIDLATATGIEVIRSNASSTYGNAAGGVVNVITVPAVTAPALEAQPVWGSFGMQRHALRAAMPLQGAGTAYASFTNTSFHGWRDHSSARRALLNAGIVGAIGTRTRVGAHLNVVNNLMHVPGPLTRAQVDSAPTQANATYLARDERRYNRMGRLGLSVDHALDASSSLSSAVFVSPRYLQRSERNTFRDFTRYHVGGNVIGRKSLRLGDLPSRITVGMDQAYQDGAILFYSLSATQGRGAELRDNKGEGAHNSGIFVQDELTLSSRLSLLLGARYDRVAYYYRSYLADPPVRSDSRDFSRVTPKLGATWRLSGTQSLYANVGGGIEVPAGNETDPTPGAPAALLNPLLEPIVSTTYEVGYKSVANAFAGGSVLLDLDAAVYDIEVRNDVIPYSAGRYYLTAGRGRRQGAELGIDATSRQGIVANAAVTLSRNRYLEYVVDSAVIFPADPARAGRIADYSGNDVVGLPSLAGTLEIGADVPGARALQVRGAVQHSGAYFADDANRVRVPGYTILDVTSELRRPIRVGGLTARGFVTVHNLTNRRYIGAAYLNPDLVGGAPAAFEPGMPRSVVVSVLLGWN